MALINKCDITCRCGERFTAEYVSYVFADIDPELKDAILKDHFNCAVCPQCGMTFFQEHPFIYRDEANKLWIEVGYPPNAAKGKDIPAIQGHYLEGQENYRQFKVADRAALIAVLFAEDPEFKKISSRLDENEPVFIAPQKGDIPVVLFYEYQGLQLGQRLHASHHDGKPDTWVSNYCTALAVHNLFNSRLKPADAERWNAVWQTIKHVAASGIYEDFAVSFADFMDDAKAFSGNWPLQSQFFTSLGSAIFNSGHYFAASFAELESALQAEQAQPA
nr:CpXC domain-containing protein [uncultured Desulfobacter sp.]